MKSLLDIYKQYQIKIMNFYSILKKCQRLWSVWDIRIVVVWSLWLQMVLIILSPFRKRSRSVRLSVIIWLCYLMADWIAIYSIGVIANHSRYSCDAGNCVDPNLAAFWAPFLLLHLGGPDTITAFSIEDNALWMRHFLIMIGEVAVVLYVLFLAIPSTALSLPFLLVFVAGTIKYAERTQALYQACYGNIKEPWSRADRMEEYAAKVKNHNDVLLQVAYRLYRISRKLIYKKKFTKDEYEEARRMMDTLEPEKAFNVVAAELSFIYDALFTKMAVVHRGGWFSYLSRLICTALIVSAFVIFSTTKKQKVPHNVDIAVTYALLVGAISLDFITWIMLVFSDRTIAFLKDCPKASNVVLSVYRKMNIYNSGWYESISQHNFISYWMTAKHRRRTRLEKWFEATIEYFGLKTTFEDLRYKYDRNVDPGLKEFIYNYLKELDPDKINEIVSSKGKRVLSRYLDDRDNILLGREYGKSLLLLHLATDLMYFTRDHSDGDDNRDINHSEICKVLSDHMFYLYTIRPLLISVGQVDLFQLKYDFIDNEIRSALRNEELSGQRDICEKLLSQQRVWETLLSQQTYVDQLQEDYTGNMFVLENASVLANHLRRINVGTNKMWEVISNVWLEMLIYGAYLAGGNAHAQQLGKGGEFITHVWLLMAHFGFTDSFWPENEVRLKSNRDEHGFDRFRFRHLENRRLG